MRCNRLMPWLATLLMIALCLPRGGLWGQSEAEQSRRGREGQPAAHISSNCGQPNSPALAERPRDKSGAAAVSPKQTSFELHMAADRATNWRGSGKGVLHSSVSAHPLAATLQASHIRLQI
jgi:hypothetical protein